MIEDQSNKAATSRSSRMIASVCDEIKALLIEKNLAYGDSALNPKRIFSRANESEQIMVRIDDKLSRIANRGAEALEDEDVLMDLMGYLVLLRVSMKQKEGLYEEVLEDERNPISGISIGNASSTDTLSLGDSFFDSQHYTFNLCDK